MHLIRKGHIVHSRGILGLEASIVLISMVIISAALAYVALNSGFSTTQKTKTLIISGLSSSAQSLEVSGKVVGSMCYGDDSCGSFISIIAIPLKISSGGDSISLDESTTSVRFLSNDVEYDNIYKGILNKDVGFIQVIDSSNHRVQVFDSSGTHLLSFGSFGAADGQFNNPMGIEIDAAGNIYTADTINHRVQVFDSQGTHQLSFGSFGAADGQFRNPFGISAGHGKIYVADTGNHRIQVFDSSGTHLLSFGSFGAADGQLSSPRGIEVDSSGKIYVADTGNHRIQVFDSSGTHLLSFGSFGAADGQLSSPFGISLDPNGKIYVADTGNHRIQVFDSSGTHLLSFGSFGAADGQFISPNGIEYDGYGKIYVADTGNHRIQVFDSSGTHQLTFGTPGAADGQFNNPRGVAASVYDQSFISTVSLSAFNNLITSKLDSIVGPSVLQTSAWIFWPVSNSQFNKSLEHGEHAVLVVALKNSDRLAMLDKMKIELVPSQYSSLSIERDIPVISNIVVDLG